MGGGSAVPIQATTGSFCNMYLSYWVGAGANDTYPQALLGGDRNLGCVGGTAASPGASQDQNYGFSAAASSSSGYEIIVVTNGTVSGSAGNSVPSSGAVGWSAKLHSAGNLAGAGNVLLGDGSAQQVTSGSLRVNWLKNGEDSGNFGSAESYSTAAGDIRFLFP
jgi:hypothetical protein